MGRAPYELPDTKPTGGLAGGPEGPAGLAVPGAVEGQAGLAVPGAVDGHLEMV